MKTTTEQAAYGETLTFEARLGGQTVRVVSKASLPSDGQVTATSRLLADVAQLAPGARVLLLGCGNGALGVALARQASDGELLLLDQSAVALAAARQTLEANKIHNAQVLSDISVLPKQSSAFDAVVLELPKGRAPARRWLLEAAGALRPEGRLYLAGPNAEGIQPVIGDAAALFGNTTPLGYRERCRAARMTRGELPVAPGWADEPGIAPGTWHTFNTMVRGANFELRSLPGIFAYDRLDDGTRLLLEHLDVPQSARALDIGCGYGIIGLWMAQAGAAQVDLVDASLLAVAAARENIAAQGLTNARALAGDVLEPVAGQTYDLIATNPPFHAGKIVAYDVAHAFIGQARKALRPGGLFVLVANSFLRYERVMQPLFSRVERLADNGRYHVWSGVV